MMRRCLLAIVVVLFFGASGGEAWLAEVAGRADVVYDLQLPQQRSYTPEELLGRRVHFVRDGIDYAGDVVAAYRDSVRIDLSTHDTGSWSTVPVTQVRGTRVATSRRDRLVIVGGDKPHVEYMLGSVESAFSDGYYELAVVGWLDDNPGLMRALDDPYPRVVSHHDIDGYQLHTHPLLGRVVRLPRAGATYSYYTPEAIDSVTLPDTNAGISHLEGHIFAVYSNGMTAISLSHSVDFEGNKKMHAYGQRVHYVFALNFP